MATINKLGNSVARCPRCDGGKSTFVHKDPGAVVVRREPKPFEKRRKDTEVHYRLFRCNACGIGALAKIIMQGIGVRYPEDISFLDWFLPEAKERLVLPEKVPNRIMLEFREAECCLEAGCFRAAAAMFRSVLNKVFRANGYKMRREDLKSQINTAASGGVITEARKRKAHDDIRVLGNDILHDEWREIFEEDVEQSHHYTQRVLEDFYDDRESVLKLLKGCGADAT